MLWSKDSRYRADGFWRCAVKNSARMAAWYAANGDRIRSSARDHYDADPIYRIEKILATGKRRRAKTLKRRREALDGPLPD